MHHRRSITAWKFLSLCAIALTLTGCGKEAVTFNNNMQKLEPKVATPLKALTAHFKGFADTKKFDAEKAEADHAATLAAIDAVTKEVKEMTPPQIDQAREFQAAFLAYFTSIREVVAGEMRQGIDLLKNPAVSEAEKIAQWSKLDVASRDKLMATLTTMQAAQKKYAEAHQMKLTKK